MFVSCLWTDFVKYFISRIYNFKNLNDQFHTFKKIYFYDYF